MLRFINRNFLQGQGTIVLLLFLALPGCKKGELLPNAAPDTFLSLESINLTGENRLNSTVNLTWFGTDIDGYVSYYEFKINEGEWQKTLVQDSTFLFDIDPDSDSTDINFYVRAVDNEGLVDPTVAYLKVPLKNSPPVITFETATLPIDTTNLVITFRYRATDPDGDNTLKQVYLRANDGNWNEIDLNQKLISVIPSNTTQTGTGNSDVYYGLSITKAATIDGFINGGDNITTNASSNSITVNIDPTGLVLSDTTPQLGGPLNADSNNIVDVGVLTANTITGALTGTVDGINITAWYNQLANTRGFDFGQIVININNALDFLVSQETLTYGSITVPASINSDFGSIA